LLSTPFVRRLPEPDGIECQKLFYYEDDIHEAKEQATGNMVSGKRVD
jgi:hypothetical protein